METSTRTQAITGTSLLARGVVDFAAPRTHALHAPRAQSLLTTAGSGGYSYDGLAVTRHNADPTRDADGYYFYLRDLDDGRVWSAGYQPTAAAPDEYDVQFAPALARFERVDADVHVRLEACLDRDLSIDLRRITLTNLGDRRRAIELTSYLEWVLQAAASDAAHPAFFKLFVETEIDTARRLILARRRRRDQSDAILAGAHWVISDGPAPAADRAWQFETSRVAFIGRDRSLRHPAALATRRPLSGGMGSVLDPAASIRQTFYLEPNESASTIFGLGARPNRDELLDAIQSLSLRHAEEAFEQRREGDSHGSRGRGTSLRVDPPHQLPHGDVTAFKRLRETADASHPRNGEPHESLEFDNGLGGFADNGREYVIRLLPDGDGRLRLPPTPWSHVVANPQAGFIATETGAGCTWTVNSRENRLTHWSNDPVTDPHTEAIYLRDRDRRVFWSPLPGPASSGAAQEVRYGFGYAQFEQSCAGLRQRVQQFVPLDDPVKLTRLSIANERAAPRDLDLFFYARLALGNGSSDQARHVRTWVDDESGALFASNPARELSSRVAFLAAVGDGAVEPTWTGDRAEFIGRYGDMTAPAAVAESQQLSGREGGALDACAALQWNLQIAAQSTADCALLLGEAADEAEARRLIARYSRMDAVDGALHSVRDSWQRLLSAVQIDTPSRAMNFMVNGWLTYQNVACRMWGRTAYYQSGGAFGFRDQLQDSAALVYQCPEMTRRQILRHAAAQFVEGDVLHWWHPHSDRGIRTRFADDLLWLPLVAAEYAATTGDERIWDENIPFVAGPPLEPGCAERFFAATAAGQTASLYEHACRALDRSLAVGAHGLPLMGCGDWNDGMNRIGADGRGESAWMAFFLDLVIARMAPVCAARGDHRRADAYRTHQARLRDAVAQHGWDGQWFRRAYFDDGSPVGSAKNGECQIDALVQAWAVLSGGADPQRSRQGIDAVLNRLVRRDLGLIQLLDPPFDLSKPDPGYIQGYVPGVRENGGQYTHGVLWFVRALAELGRGSEAVEMLDMLNPIHHARTPAEVSIYQVEPYVVAADVYSQPPHAGRGGWTWYTGSAGWMFRVAVESILGLHVRNGQELVMNPCIAAAWQGANIQYRLPAGGVYDVAIQNPDGRQSGVREARLDDQPAAVVAGAAHVPLIDDGAAHSVILRL